MSLKRASSLHVVLDVETTGLNVVQGDRIIEIGAIAVQSGSIIDEFHSFVKAPKQISKNAHLVHGITDAMLIGKPTPEAVFPQFYDFIRNSVLVAHNAKFDIGFLRSEFARHRLSLNHHYICTLEMGRRCFPRLPNHKLSTIFRHIFGISHNELESHRALGDAKRTAMIWMEMTK